MGLAYVTLLELKSLEVAPRFLENLCSPDCGLLQLNMCTHRMDLSDVEGRQEDGWMDGWMVRQRQTDR
jgi:hypothetical protein